MSHYKSNLRDLEFNLFEVLGIEEVLATGAFGDLDAATARTVLEEVRRVAEGPFAASFVDADRTPPTFDPDTHEVTLPESLKASLRVAREGGWDRLGITPELGGTHVPRAVYWAALEMLIGANPAAHFYNSGATFADILHRNGTDEQKQWARFAVERGWGATMVLTEPDAGSDVGAARTTATRQADGSWHLEGVKRFITSGDSGDLYENIFHLVLARPQGAGPGTKGLSLFFVPKFHFGPDTGEIGERNGVYVTNVEHKMGLKGSATCELTFGAHGVPATGWLVGERHDGINQMFDVIEMARMLVGTKAIATLSTGYLNALDYAKFRVQGADLTRSADKTAPKIPIIAHPDVRRSLLSQKAYAEGLRAVYLYTAAYQDAEIAAALSGADAQLAARVVDLLLPVVKGVGSERAYQYLAESLQTFGGSGYLADYPIEQYVRDAKIDSLYEGTTAIQAQDFYFRKIVKDGGVALGHVVGQIEQFLEDTDEDRLEPELALLATALRDVKAMGEHMIRYLTAAQQEITELYKVGLGSVRFLLAVGDLMIGWRLLVGARAAIEAVSRVDTTDTAETAFYCGKIAAASFFAKNMLPQLSAVRAILADLDSEIMDLDESMF